MRSDPGSSMRCMLTSVCDMVRRTEAVDFVFQISETFPRMSLDSQAKVLKVIFVFNRLTDYLSEYRKEGGAIRSGDIISIPRQVCYLTVLIP